MACNSQVQADISQRGTLEVVANRISRYGCSSVLGRESSVVGIVPVVAEIACCRPNRWQIGRGNVDTYGSVTGTGRSTAAAGGQRHIALNLTAARAGPGALRGRSPRTREGRRPDRPEVRGPEVSDGTAPESELIVDCPWFICSQRYARVRPHFGMHTALHTDFAQQRKLCILKGV